jgi:opacity protein-like surface antigen
MRLVPGLLLAGFVVTSLAPAVAQADEGFKPRFEITPFVGYRTGDDFDLEDANGVETSAEVDDAASYGFDLGIYRDRTSFYEILYSRKQGDLDFALESARDAELTTEYYHFGGTLLFPDEGYVVPWLSLTIGATRLAASGPYDSETRFSTTLGGGLRLPVTDHVSASLGVRGYLTLLDSDSDIFCVGSGDLNCAIRSTGSTYLEFEASLGLNVVF